MEFKDFLKYISEAESTAEKDDKAEKAGKKVAKDIEYDEGHKGKDDKKAEKAGKKVAKDIEYDDKKDKKKKKSLKDWVELVDKQQLQEAEQIQVVPAKQTTSVIKQGNKTLGSVSNPQLAQQIKQSIGKGEMSLAGTEIKEEEIDEKWAGDAKVEPTGQYAGKSVEELKSMLAKLKKSGPHKEGSPGFKKMRQVMFAIRAKKGWKGGVEESAVEESGLQAYLGKKKYGPEGMKALQKAGREGASKEKMAQIRAKHDKLDEVQVDEKAKNPYAIGMAAAKKAAGITKKHATDLPKNVVVKGHEIAKKIKKQEKTNEAERPSDQVDMGAGLGAGRSQTTLEGKKPDFLDLDKDGNKKESMKKAAADKKKKKVDEAMNTCEAAYHEGKSHGLSKHGYACRYDEGSDEHKRYHEGYVHGLDECYGMGIKNEPIIGMDEAMPAATVPGMASQAMPAMEADLDEMNKTQYMQHKAKTTPGDTFKAFGQTMHDKDVLEADAFAFESLDKQLNELLNEGLSVNMSQGLGGAGSEDSVSVTAQGDDAAKLLDFIKQVGLGGLGGMSADKEGLAAGEPAVIATVSDYGAPKFSGHDNPDMKALLQKVGVDDGEDYKGEKADDHEHSEGCGCGETKEMVDEVETEDQMAYQVAEDDGEGYEQSQADAGKIDSALALSGASKGGAVNEGGDGGEASEETVDNSPGTGESSQSDKEAQVNEWANNAGKNGTDAAFEQDIEFMTKVISGGLNKPKSTGQTTIPVIAGQDARTGDEDVTAWKRLAGLLK